MPPAPARENLTRFAWLSIAAAVATIALKFGAYLLTGSVGLLSDAAESVVNLVAAFVALIALHVAAQPADVDHQFGHSKAEYFSAAVEGVMIFVAAIFILWSSVQRFFAPEPLENVGMGLGISVAASAYTTSAGTRTPPSQVVATLVADRKHLLTDVWTSVGVVVGVLLVVLTGWLRLDPIIAFLVGCNIIWTGWHLVRESVDGLMDHAPSPEGQADIQAILDEFAHREGSPVLFHGVRARVAGHVQHVAFHVLVPGTWTVTQGHDLLEEIEGRFHEKFGHIVVDTHLEPIEDPRSYDAPQWESASP